MMHKTLLASSSDVDLSVNQMEWEITDRDMQSLCGQTLYQVAFLFKTYESVMQGNCLSFDSVLFEHRDLNANSEGLSRKSIANFKV